jgi:hypothetical protein
VGGMMKVYRKIAGLIHAMENCTKDGKLDWYLIHKKNAEAIVERYLPSGSGFDGGTQIHFGMTTSEKLVFLTGFHHMNENGFYTEWTHHRVTIKPSLAFGFNITITGRDVKNIKDHIGNSFAEMLDMEYEEEKK